MSKSQGQISAILPWNFITEFHEGVVVQKDGILQRSFAYHAPDADSLGGFQIEQLSVNVHEVAKRLGQGWAFFIEAQRFCTTEYPKDKIRFSSAFSSLAPYLIEREREKSFTTFGKHFESSYFITFAWRPPAENIKKITSIFISSARGTSKAFKENVDFFVNETDSVVALLSNNMFIVPLNNKQTIAYLHSSISFNRLDIHLPEYEICLDRILPDEVLENSLTMRLGSRYIPIVGVNDFPEENYPAIFERLNRIRMEYRWVTRWICLSKEEGKKVAQKKEKAHRGARKTFMQTFAESTSSDGSSGSSVENHGAGIKEADSILAGAEIETDQAALGFYTSCVMVWDKDFETAKRKAEMVRYTINGAGFTCMEETYNALEAFMGMLPGGVFANLRKMAIMSYNLSCCVPLSSVWSGTRENVHAGRVCGSDLPHVTCSTHEGTPFFFSLNPGDGDVGHAAIWGPTGAGKSTLLNLLEMQFFRYPDSQVIVFDKGRSCRLPCMACGGLFFEPAADNLAGISFQPLRDLETDRDMQDAIDFIESLFEVTGYTVEPQLRTEIKDNLELMKTSPKEHRTLTSFVHYANSYLNPKTGNPLFKEQLADYIYPGGKYMKIFDSSVTGLSLDTRFLAFEMEALMNLGPGAVVPALIYLFNVVEHKFDGRLTLLILDEAWLFLKNDTFSSKISEWLKVLRKKNVFVVFATQDVADVANSSLKTTITQQCLTKIYLADPSALTSNMFPVYSAFGLTDTEIEFIAHSQMKRDYFYTSPLGRRMFQLDLGRLTLALIGAPNHKLLDALIAEKGFGVPLCRDILEAARVGYEHLMRGDAPSEEQPKPVSPAAGQPPSVRFLPPLPVAEAEAHAFSSSSSKTIAASILDAAATLSDRRKKGEGRAAETLAEQLGVSPSTIYQAQKILKYGNQELVEQVRKGEIGIKKASKGLKQKEPEQACAG